MRDRIWAVIVCAAAMAGCSSTAQVDCGPGTVLQGSTCVPADGGTGDSIPGDVATDTYDATRPDAPTDSDAEEGSADVADANDGEADAAPVKLPWTKHYGGTGNDQPLGVTVNAVGEIIVHGFSQSSSLDLGKGVITLPAGTPGFLAKLDAAGTTLWTKTYWAEGSGAIDATTQAVDSAGNIFVGGGLYKTTSVNFGDAKLAAVCSGSGAPGCAYVAKIDGAGKYVWGKYFAASVANVDGLACDGTNVVLTGHFAGSIDFGLGSLSGVGSDTEIFLARLGPDGKALWAKRFNGGSAGSDGTSVAVDAGGNVLLTGFFTGTIDFGGGALVSAGGTDIFLAKFDSTGVHVWSKRFGDVAVEQGGSGVKADVLGNVVLDGYLVGSADFGGGSLSAAGTGSRNIFVARLTPAGTHVWSKVFGGSGGAEAGSLAIDAKGDVLLTGAFGDSINFGGGPLTGTTTAKGDMFIAKLTSAGAHIWSHHFGGPTSKYAGGTGLVLDLVGNAVVLGGFDGTTTNFDDGLFPGASYTSAGNEDIFLGKFMP